MFQYKQLNSLKVQIKVTPSSYIALGVNIVSLGSCSLFDKDLAELYIQYSLNVLYISK